MSLRQPVRRFQQGPHPVPDGLLKMVAADGPVVADRDAAEAMPVGAAAAILAVLAL